MIKILINNSIKHIYAVIFNPFPAYTCFLAFIQSHKSSRGDLMRAQAKYQDDFCHWGTYLMSCLSRMVLMESSELP